MTEGSDCHNLRMVFRCRARTEEGGGGLCRRKVKERGARCYQHKGQPEAAARQSKSHRSPKRAFMSVEPSTKSRKLTKNQDQAKRRQELRTAERAAAQERRRQERIRVAAVYCSDVVTTSWQTVVAERATEYVTRTTWEQLFASNRRKHCKTLAEIAAALLTGKQKIHDWFGSLVARFMERWGASEIERIFAKELASRMPLPHEAKIVAVARGVQVTGILLCVVEGNDLTSCQCFIDLALAETKTRVKKILEAAVRDWAGLAEFPPRSTASGA